MRVAAVVTAAGSGARFGGLKQFEALTPTDRLVDRAVATVRVVADWVVAVLPEDHRWSGAPLDAVTSGGASRHASIAAGLHLVPPGYDAVIVHSASHPLASVVLARRLLSAIEAGADGAVPVMGLADVAKRIEQDGSITSVGRDGLGLAQCPMAFERAALDRAFASGREAVEESELVEAIGGRVVAVEAEVTNVHVVDAASLALARTIAAAGGVV